VIIIPVATVVVIGNDVGVSVVGGAGAADVGIGGAGAADVGIGGAAISVDQKTS
jgi:hypothetical protein